MLAGGPVLPTETGEGAAGGSGCGLWNQPRITSRRLMDVSSKNGFERFGHRAYLRNPLRARKFYAKLALFRPKRLLDMPPSHLRASQAPLPIQPPAR